MELRLLRVMKRNMNKVNNSYFIYFFGIILLFATNCFSQNLDVLQKNKAPGVENGFGNNDTNVNMHTGKSNTSIPIHNFIGRELNLPISLNYTANGVRVDQVASNVGLGWNLDVGGKISRQVVNVPDDYFYTASSTYCNQRELQENDNNDFYVCNALNTNDIFKFAKKEGNQIVSYKNPGTIVACSSIDGRAQGLTDSEWTVTNTEGTKFYFGQNQTKEKIVTNLSTCPDSGGYSSTTTWMLTKVISKNNLDVYEFAYQNYQWLDAIPNYGEGNQNYTTVITSSDYKLNQQMITEIKHNGEKIIGFTYNPRNDLNFVGGNSIGNALSEIKFYNFKSNIDFYKKVNFTYSYFGNSNSINFLDKRLKLDEVIFYGSNNSFNDKYTFDYINPSLVPSLKSCAKDYLGLYNGKNENTDLIPIINGGMMLANPNEDVAILEEINSSSIGKRAYNYQTSIAGTLNKITYPSKGYTTFDFEQNALIGGYGHSLIPDFYENQIAEIDRGSIEDCYCTNNNIPTNYKIINPEMSPITFFNYPGSNINNSSGIHYISNVKTAIMRINQLETLKFNSKGNGIYLIQKISPSLTFCSQTNDVVQNFTNSSSSISVTQGAFNLCLTPTSLLFYKGNGFSLPANFISGGITNTGLIDKTFDVGTYQITLWSYNVLGEIKASVKIFKENTVPTLTTPAHWVSNDLIADLVEGFRIKSVSNYSEFNKIILKKEYKYSYGIKTNRVKNFSVNPYTMQGNTGYTVTSRGYLDFENVHYEKVYEISKDNNIDNGYVEYCFKDQNLDFLNEEDTITAYGLPVSTLFRPQRLEYSYLSNYRIQDNITSPFTNNSEAKTPAIARYNYNNSNNVVRKRIYNKEEQLLNEDNFYYYDFSINVEPDGATGNYKSKLPLLYWKYSINFPNPSFSNKLTAF